MPKLSDLQKYTQVTPATFKFSVKMSKYITHIIKLKDSKQSISDFQYLILEGLSDKLEHLWEKLICFANHRKHCNYWVLNSFLYLKYLIVSRIKRIETAPTIDGIKCL